MSSIRRLYNVSPLSAAIAEAANDRELQRIIQFRFQKLGECSTSELFPTIEAVETFYEHSFGIIGVVKPPPLLSFPTKLRA